MAYQSNLDLTGARVVRVGCLVSWHGLRFVVAKVQAGTCVPLHPSDSFPPRVPCCAVQVVVPLRY